MAIIRLENGLGKNLKRAENNLNSTGSNYTSNNSKRLKRQYTAMVSIKIKI